MAITTQPCWQVTAGGTLVGFFDNEPAAAACAATYAPTTYDTYVFEAVNYIYSEDEE